ncbi:hypothetical protein T02_174 [Trichinella nativa]|uniref:Uncharacterized protein n=1 Tax=Trichinella nativa TaxID=6335 RepID=A0A0V1LPZ7_9BILA|nr:hypothetical protein T02_174 [Trichinella nativa]
MYPRRIVKGLGKMHFFFCKAVLSAMFQRLLFTLSTWQQWHLFISCATFLRKNFLTYEDAVRAKEFGVIAKITVTASLMSQTNLQWSLISLSTSLVYMYIKSTTGRWKMVDFEINIQPFFPLYLFHLCLLGVGVMRKKY